MGRSLGGVPSLGLGGSKGPFRVLSLPRLHEVTAGQAGKPAPEVKGLSWDIPAHQERGSPGSPDP